MAAAVIEANLTEIDSATLRRDSPEDVREVFETELGGFLEILEFGVDLRAIAFPKCRLGQAKAMPFSRASSSVYLKSSLS